MPQTAPATTRHCVGLGIAGCCGSQPMRVQHARRPSVTATVLPAGHRSLSHWRASRHAACTCHSACRVCCTCTAAMHAVQCVHTWQTTARIYSISHSALTSSNLDVVVALISKRRMSWDLGSDTVPATMLSLSSCHVILDTCAYKLSWCLCKHVRHTRSHTTYEHPVARHSCIMYDDDCHAYPLRVQLCMPTCMRAGHQCCCMAISLMGATCTSTHAHAPEVWLLHTVQGCQLPVRGSRLLHALLQLLPLLLTQRAHKQAVRHARSQHVTCMHATTLKAATGRSIHGGRLAQPSGQVPQRLTKGLSMCQGAGCGVGPQTYLDSAVSCSTALLAELISA